MGSEINCLFNATEVPDELRALQQWVNWCYDTREGKLTKIPVQADGSPASVTNPSTWSSFETVSNKAATRKLLGVGVVLNEGDPYLGIDLDYCIDETGQVAAEAMAIVERFDSYTEITPSDQGLRVILRGKWCKGRGNRMRPASFKQIAVYDHARYFTVTGKALTGTSGVIREAQLELDRFADQYFPAKTPEQLQVTAPDSFFDGTDNELLQAAQRAKNGEKFLSLFRDGDLSAHGGDHSKADFALVGMLAFYAGNNHSRIDTLFRRSALMRPKWDERHGAQTYGELTIWKAVEARVRSGVFYAPKHVLANFEFEKVEGEQKPKKRAIPLPLISQCLLQMNDGWPKRVGQLMFVDHGEDVRYLENVPDLFAWIGDKCDVRWDTGNGIGGMQLTPKNEFLAHLRCKVQDFETVETIPHEPPMPKSYYTWRGVAEYEPDGQHLQAFLNFFDNTATDVDRALIRAMFLTPVWGGRAGTRPGFLIVADDRGHGKSTLAEAASELYGGIDLEPDGGNEDRIISRLLTPSAMTARVVRIDNVKQVVSSGLLESLITSAKINGHRLYHGDASRPNFLTWIITGNGVRASRDISERCFTIRLAKPKFRSNWREEVFNYLAKYRRHIVGDVVYLLQQPAKTSSATDRWQSWVDNVLSRVTADPGSITVANQTRRNEADQEIEEADVIGAALGASSLTFIASEDAARLINQALGVQWKTTRVTRTVKEHIAAGRLRGVEYHREGHSRGFSMTLPPTCDTSVSQSVTA